MKPGIEYFENGSRSFAARLPARGLRYEPRPGLSIPSISVLDSQGRVIEPEQRRLFRYNSQQGYGANIIFGGGTNGEWNRISNGERQRLMMILADEVSRINREQEARGAEKIEAWVGVTARTRAETLANLECALDARADAAVIAPLSIEDSRDMIDFFQREVSDLFDHKSASVPIFLYDNAEIAIDPRVPHIHTRDVKKLSRLPFIYGLKVSAPRRVLGNYTKGALHYKDRGGFGIYIGDAMLMFQVFRLEDGLAGRAREYWNRYLLHNELPVGVVSGPANVFPREWQRAWRACYVGDERLMAVYHSAFDQFLDACRFTRNGRPASKLIACLKYSLKLEGVIESDLVAEGTPALTGDDRHTFAEKYARIKNELADSTDSIWRSVVADH